MQKTIDAIIEGARTGKNGDGKIFVLEVADHVSGPVFFEKNKNNALYTLLERVNYQ